MSKKYKLKDVLNKIIQDDHIKVTRKMSLEIADLFFGSPYFLQLSPKKLIRWGVKTEIESPERELESYLVGKARSLNKKYTGL